MIYTSDKNKKKQSTIPDLLLEQKTDLPEPVPTPKEDKEEKKQEIEREILEELNAAKTMLAMGAVSAI